jgi:hypothetical protein
LLHWAVGLVIADVSKKHAALISKSQRILEEDVLLKFLDPDLKISCLVWNPKSHPF